MDSAHRQILQIDWTDWSQADAREDWAEALEDGKVLHFPHIGFQPTEAERAVLSPALLAKGVRNISLGMDDRLKGVVSGDEQTEQTVFGLVSRFRQQAQTFIDTLFPRYRGHLRMAPVSLRPMQVEDRAQSWRADDKRLHVDAFPSRPNRGERILRVFTNLNPDGQPRVWRVGESFEDVARHFMPRLKPYVAWQARALHAIGVTKSLRTEYDHLMLQLHDAMKADMDYQRTSPQITVPFQPGAVWVCFSDQATHAVMSGQYMMELTAHLDPQYQYWPERSPLGVLQRLTGHSLI